MPKDVPSAFLMEPFSVQPTLRNLLARYLRARSEDGRLSLVCAIMKMDPAEVMQVCREDVRSKSWKLRCRAACVLSELGHPQRPFLQERIALLSQLAVDDRNRQVRVRATQSLGTIHTPSALRQLARLSHDADPDVRRFAAVVLWKLGKRGVDRLVALSRDTSPGVREMAAFAMGFLGQRARTPARTALLRLCSDRSKAVREEAVRGLVCTRDERSVGLLLSALHRVGVSNELVGAVQELSFFVFP